MSSAEKFLEAKLPQQGLAGCFIDGRWHWPQSNEKLAIENPSKRQTLAEIGLGTGLEIDLAVKAASRAFESYKTLAGSERGRLLAELSRRITANAEEIARLLAGETGNSIKTQSRGEVAGAAAVFNYYAGVGVELKGETLPLGDDVFYYTTREPIGVVGSIIPWNSPLQLGAVKISMALITGNTLVLKPAEDAPLAILRITELAQDIFPPGVLNVVTGYGEDAGAALAKHPGVAKLSFTGSSDVGKLVAHCAADRIAKVTLELGGKSPCIVFPDAAQDRHIDSTVTGIINAMRFARQGQSCTAGSRLFVHDSIWDKVMPRVIDGVSKMKVGDALDESNDIGAVINAQRYNDIRDYVLGAQRQGCEFLMGEPPRSVENCSGYFTHPAILSGLDNTWRIAREEVFGPILVAIPWSEEKKVIKMANDTHYGLAAFIFSHDVSTVLRVSRKIDAGWIQINQGGGQIPGTSYGGTKQSGIGCEYSIEGALEAYTYRKSITMAIKTA